MGGPAVRGEAEGAIWSGRIARSIASSPLSRIDTDADICPTTIMLVEISGESASKEACVYGNVMGLRLARYHSPEGPFVYAAASSTDSKFLRVKNFCEGLAWCVYGQGSNVALVQTRISTLWYGHKVVSNFSHHLELHQGSEPHYEYKDEYGEPLKSPARTFATGTVGISAQGNWALIELHDYGFIRVNLRTLEMRRVVAPGVGYGLSSDPTFETAITDDGRHAAITGFRAGLEVYDISNTCGDLLAEVSTTTFPLGMTKCGEASIDRYRLFPGMTVGHMPRFSPDGRSLSLIVYTTASQEVATIAPEGVLVSSAARYVAFGDSFTSGEGEVDDTFYLPNTTMLSNHCHVSIRSYPYLLGSAWGVPALNRACSGSRMQGVVAAVHSEAKVSPRPSLLSLSVGGNDADLTGKLKECLGVGTCDWANPIKRIASANEMRALLPRLIETIAVLRASFPGAALFVIGYPSVINERPSAPCRIGMSELLNQNERQYFSESIAYLNAVLKVAAQSSRVQFVDIEAALVGERLCDWSERAVNALRYGDDIAPVSFLDQLKIIGAESFHPTPFGHTLVASEILKQRVTPDQGITCDCHVTPELLALSSYWTEQATPAWQEVRQLYDEFLTAPSAVVGSTIKAAFAAGTFLAGEVVKFELHSQPQHLATYRAASDGSLQGSITLPEGTFGYHAVHAVSKSASGLPLDIYQTLHVTSRRVALSEISNSATTIQRESPRGPGDVLGVVSSSTQAPPGHLHHQEKASQQSAHLSSVLLPISVAVLAIAFIVNRIKKRLSISRRGG